MLLFAGTLERSKRMQSTAERLLVGKSNSSNRMPKMDGGEWTLFLSQRFRKVGLVVLKPYAPIKGDLRPKTRNHVN